MEEESIDLISVSDDATPEDDETSDALIRPPSQHHRRTVPIIITLTLFVIIIGAIIGVTVVRQHHRSTNQSSTLRRHHRRTKPSEMQQSFSVINAACALTRLPESCYTAVSSVNSGNVIDDVVNPETIFNLTLQRAFNEVANLSSLFKTLILNSNDLRTGSVLRDCATLFDDSVSQLSWSVESVSDVGELTERKVVDMMTWISAVMTDIETCVDGLEEMGSTVVDEVKVRVQRSSVYLINCLTLLAN